MHGGAPPIRGKRRKAIRRCSGRRRYSDWETRSRRRRNFPGWPSWGTNPKPARKISASRAERSSFWDRVPQPNRIFVKPSSGIQATVARAWNGREPPIALKRLARLIDRVPLCSRGVGNYGRDIWETTFRFIEEESCDGR